MSISRTRNNYKPLLVILGVSLLISITILFVTANLPYYYLLLVAFGLPVGVIGVRALLISVTGVREFFSSLHWWHGLWVMMILSGLVWRKRDSAAIADNPLDIWAIYRIALIGILGLILLTRLLKRKTDWFKILVTGSIGLLTGYALIAIFSTLWSVYPLWTLYKSVEYLIDLALISAIVVAARNVNDFKNLFDLAFIVHDAHFTF